MSKKQVIAGIEAVRLKNENVKKDSQQSDLVPASLNTVGRWAPHTTLRLMHLSQYLNLKKTKLFNGLPNQGG